MKTANNDINNQAIDARSIFMTHKSDFLLSKDELADLSGFKLKSKQIEWLRKTNIPFYIAGNGHPKVTYAAIHGQKNSTVKPAWQPNVLKKR